MDYSRVCSLWMEDTEQSCLTGSEESRIMLLQKDYTSESLGSRYTDNNFVSRPILEILNFISKFSRAGILSSVLFANM